MAAGAADLTELGMGVDRYSPRLVVGEIFNLLPVNPRLDARSLGDYPELVPLAILELLVRDEAFLGRQPAATGGLAINVTGFRSLGAAGLDLLARC